MPKVRKVDVILVCDLRVVLFYISNEYHQNIPKGIRVKEQTGYLFQTKERTDKKFYIDADANGICSKKDMFPLPSHPFGRGMGGKYCY